MNTLYKSQFIIVIYTHKFKRKLYLTKCLNTASIYLVYSISKLHLLLQQPSSAIAVNSSLSSNSSIENTSNSFIIEKFNIEALISYLGFTLTSCLSGFRRPHKKNYFHL